MKKLILIFVLGVLFHSAVHAQELGIQKGEKFPITELETIDGRKLNIDSLSDKIFVVNWWFTTCKPCIMEIPGLNSLVEKYKENPRVVFVAIAFDTKKNVDEFLLKQPFDYIQTLRFNPDFVKILGSIFPSNLIIDRNRNVFYKSSGGGKDTYKEVEESLQKLLNL